MVTIIFAHITINIKVNCHECKIVMNADRELDVNVLGNAREVECNCSEPFI